MIDMGNDAEVSYVLHGIACLLRLREHIINRSLVIFSKSELTLPTVNYIYKYCSAYLATAKVYVNPDTIQYTQNGVYHIVC